MRYKHFLPCLLLFTVLFNPVSAGVLNATISQKEITSGDTFTIHVSVRNDFQQDKTPNLKPLEKNFSILGTAKRQQISIFNGRVIRNDQWIITLTPKKTGVLVIPAFTIGTDKTRPLSIGVIATQKAINQGQQPIFIDVSMNPKKFWVQSQIIYQMRIYYSINVPMANITPPSAADTIILQTDPDKTFKKTINGKLYHVFQRTFLLFPQHSGKLTITPAVFSGEITEKLNTVSHAGFSVLNIRPIQLTAPEFNLDINDIPGDYHANWWLPAKNIVVTQTWSTAKDQIFQGTPIARTVTIRGTGVLADQLPKIITSNSNAYNVYSDTTALKDTFNNNQPVAIRTQKITYIPVGSSNMTIPDISISWWNIDRQEQEVSSIPGKHFIIIVPRTSSQMETAASVAATRTTIDNTENHRPLLAVIIALAIMTILISATAWGWRHLHKTILSNAAGRHIMWKLKRACFESRPHRANQMLIQLGRHCFPNQTILNISDVKNIFGDADLIEELTLLQLTLYGNQSDRIWSGENLWRCMEKIKPDSRQKPEKNLDVLPKLNPENKKAV